MFLSLGSNGKLNLLTCYLQREEHCLFSSCCFIYFCRTSLFVYMSYHIFPRLQVLGCLFCLNTTIILNIVHFCPKQKSTKEWKMSRTRCSHLDKINNYCLSFNKEKWKRKMHHSFHNIVITVKDFS